VQQRKLKLIPEIRSEINIVIAGPKFDTKQKGSSC
jgi:hypothetical protein